MKNNPDLWKGMYERLLPVYGSDIIFAGGCVRDFLLNETHPKDIDIFVNVPTELDLEIGAVEVNIPLDDDLNAVITVGFDNLRVMDQEGAEYNCNSHTKQEFEGLVSVLHGWYYPDTESSFDVNIMAYPLNEFNGTNLVSRFDHSLCQAWWTPDEGIKTSEAFTKTLKTKKITEINPDARTPGRLERLYQKHPQFAPKNKNNKEKYNYGIHNNFKWLTGIAPALPVR